MRFCRWMSVGVAGMRGCLVVSVFVWCFVMVMMVLAE